MTRMKSRMKKGMAGILAAVMAAGLMTSIPGSVETVNADSNTPTEPRVIAYATKDQLVNWDYANTVGKITFGKNYRGNTLEWYILGNDSGMSGDNTVIFAADIIAGDRVFDSNDRSVKSFASGDGTYATSEPDIINVDHYGASDLRGALQDMMNSSNTTYFTAAEKSMMQATTVTTEDLYNNLDYTTTDILYALKGEHDAHVLYAGSNNDKTLSQSTYWSSGDLFWLRTPYNSGYGKQVLYAHTNDDVSIGDVTSTIAVRPASNLNLSSVLFASSATAEYNSGTLYTSEGDAMTLRLDGTDKNIGTATYNPATRSIQVEKGSTSQEVSLIVQGDDGSNGWYYSVTINTSATISTENVRSSLGLPSVDLSKCKIWLEITDTDGLLYAVNATEAPATDISSVAITGIDAPVANTALDTEASCATTGVSTTIPITWSPADSTAAYNTSYTASLTLTPGTGYEFTDSTIVTLNGNAATSVTKNSDGTLTVTYAFPSTAKDKSASTTDPKSDSKADKTDGNTGASTNQTGNKTTDGASKTGATTSNVSPKTGDDISVAWIAVLLLLSGTGLVIVANRRRLN